MIKPRLGSKKDEEQIYSLFLECGYKYKKKFWSYINQLNNKNKSSIICLLEINNKIVGHYSFMLRNIYIGIEKIPICYASQVMIHPEFRGLKNIKMLINFAQDQVISHGFKHIVGFPNRNIDKIYERFFNWRLIYKKKIYKKNLTLNNYNKYEISSIKNNDTKKFLSQFKKFFFNEFENNIETIKHIICNNPHYNFDLIEINDHGKIINSIIVKYHYLNNKKIAHILYFNKTLNFISLKSLEDYFYNKNVSYISCWKYNFLESEYILDENYYNTFYYKNLTDDVIDFKNFNIFMIDCDVYYF